MRINLIARRKNTRLLTLLGSVGWGLGSALQVHAAEVGNLPEVTVSTPAGPVAEFEVAGSVDWVDGEQLRQGRPQFSLAEGLRGVPGLQLQDRGNHAQDVQLSIRGFGARSGFGVRGVRLYVDGIPATLTDGQGQTSNIDLASVERVEVLRGPFSALYGNSSGGVVQVFTEDGDGAPRLDVSSSAGSFGSARAGAKLSGSSERLSYVISANRFRTDGWRTHATARRDVFNAKLGLDAGGGERVYLMVNHVRVRAQDPLGLSAEQLQTDARQGSAALARQYDTHKNVEQTQFGLRHERRMGADSTLGFMAYAGRREMLQLLAIPPAPQANPAHSGGVVAFERDYVGADVRWSTRTQLAARPLHLLAGIAWDDLRERRRGYENFAGTGDAQRLGVVGALRRHERNRVSNLDPYLQASWQLAPRWRAEAGMRRSQVRFDSRDQYVVGANGDDSYVTRYRRWLPTAALRYQPSRNWAWHLALGRGFETPTLNELAYSASGGAGVNTGLQPASSRNLELGLKGRLGSGLLTAALFQVGTRDEIVTLANVGGRASYQNAGRTRRRGLELSWLHESHNHWHTRLAWTWLDARYREGFCAPAPCGPSTEVAAGLRLPGVARQSLYAALSWAPPQGWQAGLEWRAQSGVYANDRNTARAPGHGLLALYAGYGRSGPGWQWQAFVRVDNALARRAVGSVIVNEGNARYFEPLAGRSWSLGLQGSWWF